MAHSFFASSSNSKKKDFDFTSMSSSYDRGLAGKLSEPFYRLVCKESRLKQGMKVLDVGCGVGLLLQRLNQAKKIDAYGVDINPTMLDIARQRLPEGNFAQAVSEAMPYEDHTFDRLTACMAYHHFDDKESFAYEAARVLKPGGLLLIADPRFPSFLMKLINSIMDHLGIIGHISSPKEIARELGVHGFKRVRLVKSGYAQLIVLRLSSPEE